MKGGPSSSQRKLASVEESGSDTMKNWGQTPIPPPCKIYHPPGVDQSGARVTASSQPAMSSGFSLPFHAAPYFECASDIMFRH